MNYNVSVIVCMYNPDLGKAISTIKSACLQKNIDIEIIVVDDGSENNYKEEIIKFSKNYDNIPLRFIDNSVNKGTVKNCISGLEVAKGEYSYIISPGDYFFDEFTLHDMYQFAKSKQIDICFGRLQYYKKTSEGYSLLPLSSPTAPSLYSSFLFSIESKALAYCTISNQVIVGASFLRRTRIALQYLQEVQGMSIYDEDNTSTYIHLLKEKKDVCFCDRYVAWYEYGTGISTSNNESFITALNADCDRVLKYINNLGYSKHIIDYMKLSNNKERLLRHPILFVKRLFIKIYCKIKKNRVSKNTISSFFHSLNDNN